MMRRVILATLASTLTSIGALACAGFGYQTQALHDSMRGMTAKTLRGCLGPPPNVFVDQTTELWVYQRALRSGSREVTVQLAEGEGTAHKRPDVLEGAPSSTHEADPRHLTPESGSVAPGQCRLAFQLNEGVVAAVDTTGISVENLNADHACALYLKPCAGETP